MNIFNILAQRQRRRLYFLQPLLHNLFKNPPSSLHLQSQNLSNPPQIDSVSVHTQDHHTIPLKHQQYRNETMTMKITWRKEKGIFFQICSILSICTASESPAFLTPETQFSYMSSIFYGGRRLVRDMWYLNFTMIYGIEWVYMI